jgi:hypothetical protein
MTSFSISMVERQVLFKKYIKLGYNYEEAEKRIKDFTEYLKSLKQRLRQREIPEVDINIRFKKEFEILCQRLDAGNDWIANRIRRGGRR